MELSNREKTIKDLRKDKRYREWVIVGLVASLVAVTFKLATQSTVVQLEIPGAPSGMQTGPSWMDLGGKRAVLLAVTDHLVGINPSNAQEQKAFIQAFLSPDQYTRISLEIDAKVAKMTAEHELGSYYWVWKGGVEYDPLLDRHFFMGEVHTVNAAKDTAEPYVYEYKMHVSNYRPVVDDVQAYPGDRPHNSAWIEAAKK